MNAKRFLLLIVVLVLIFVPSHARADIAPPAQPPGSNLEPGAELTQVRMLAETVVIDVQPTTPAKSLGQAHVTASFTMHNMGAASESMAVRFPLGADDGQFNINEIADFRVRVNGHSVATHRIMGEDSGWSDRQVPWASFDVTFPPAEDVPVEVQYTLEASGEYPFVYFDYVLSTGSGWKDSIGSADIIVQLPYDVTDENVLFDNPGFSMLGTKEGGVIDGNAIRWHFDALEPTDQDNFEVNLVMPSAWQRYLAEEKNVAQHPADGEGWGRLGKVCKEMAFSSRGKGFRAGGTLDLGGAKLFHRSLEAYDKAVTLLPNDALWHAGYADLLGYHAYFAAFAGIETTQEAVHAMREIHTALALSPNDAKVREIAETISYSFPNGMKLNGDVYDFPWLTATPTRKDTTQVPSATPHALPTFVVVDANPTPTTRPSQVPTVTAQPTQPTPPANSAPSKPSVPFCGSALLLPLAMIGGTLVRRRSGRSGR